MSSFTQPVCYPFEALWLPTFAFNHENDCRFYGGSNKLHSEN